MQRYLAFLLFLTGLFAGCEAQTYKIVTRNMSPSLKVGEIKKGAKLNDDSELKRFDIIVFKLPEEVRKVSGDKPGALIISRIIGLPGEKVEIKDGVVYIDDAVLTEQFDVTADPKDAGPIVVPEKEYYLLGDNRPESLDSRHWKQRTISRSDISARIEDIK